MKTNAKEVREEIIAPLKGRQGVKLATIICKYPGNEASEIYVRNKEKLAERLGFEADTIILTEPDAAEMFYLIEKLSNDDSVTGILLQLPIFPELRGIQEELLNRIPPIKDVDGFGPNALVTPCTPKGIMKIFDHVNYNLEGQEVLLIGRGKTIGRPMIDLLLKENATLTIAHSKTEPSSLIHNEADVVIAASDVILDDAILEYPRSVVIDAGIFREDNGIRGCFTEAAKARTESGIDLIDHYTSSPGGVGLLTVACLMENLVELKDIQEGKE